MTEPDVGAALEAAEKTAKERARKIKAKLGSIAEHIEAIPALVAEAYEAKDWRHLGYPTWEAYVHGEYETHLIKVNAAVRKSWTAQFKEIGMRTREIAPVVNVSQPTVSRDSSESAPKAPASATPQADTKAMREWATAQNMDDVPSRGRLPARIVEAYQAAHGAEDDEIVEGEIVEDETERARIERERRERASAAFGRAIVSLGALLNPDPHSFIQKTWDRELCPDLMVTSSRPYFEPAALRKLAGHLNKLADSSLYEKSVSQQLA